MNPTPGRRPPWVDDDLFPFESRFVEIDGHQIHYVDEGDGPVMLMVHGNPTWSFLYRDLIGGLRARYRCVAFDLPGFGLSTAAAGYGFSVVEHSDTAAAFVERLDLTGVTPFVQDWGGPIGLKAALRDPSRYRALVVGNTFAWPANRLLWKATSRALGGPLGRVIVENLNLLVGSIPRVHTRSRLSDAEIEHYRAPFPYPAARRPVRVFLRQITAARAALSELERSLPALAHLPTLILWGNKDAFYGERELRRIERIFPDHRTHILSGVGHFIQDDAPVEIIELIRGWASSVD